MADKFGLGSEIWDALRARTLNLPHDAAGNTIVDAGNLGLGNKIILYDSGGLDLRLFPPTQAGLVAALTDSTSGDTVWLPSIPIPQTAGVTLPAGVALRGIDHKAILSASGFNGSAVTMAIGALCSGFSLDYASTLATDIGINAGFEDAIVHDVWVDVDEGIGIELGGTVLAEEAWFLMQFKNGETNTGSIVYSTDAFVSDTNEPIWKICPRPSDASNIWSTGGSSKGSFVILEDGSSAYVSGKISGSSPENWAIWRTNNPRAVNPTWAIIFQGGDAISPTNNVIIGQFVANLERHGDLIIATMRTIVANTAAYAEYNTASGAWSFHEIGSVLAPNDVRNERAAYRAFTATKNPFLLREPVTLGIIDTASNHAAASLPGNVWRNRASGPIFYSYKKDIVALNILRDGTNAADRVSGFSGGDPRDVNVRGHLAGAGVAFVDEDGETLSNVWVSSDGITFTEKTAWGAGTVEFVGQQTGEGRACWIKRIAGNNTAMFRKTADILIATPAWTDTSGNFWGTQAQVDAGTAIMPTTPTTPTLNLRTLWTVYR